MEDMVRKDSMWQQEYVIPVGDEQLGVELHLTHNLAQNDAARLFEAIKEAVEAELFLWGWL